MTLRFGTDGVRGVANAELTVELVTALGRAAVRVLGAERARSWSGATRAGRARCSKPRWSPASAPRAPTSLLAGVLPTPGVATSRTSAVRTGRGDLGQPQPVRRQRHQALRARRAQDPRARSRAQVEAGAPRASPARCPRPGADGVEVGVASELRNALDDYVEHLVDALEGRRLDGLHVVVDCGNGAAFRAAPAALRALGAEVDVLHASPTAPTSTPACGSTDTPTQLQRRGARRRAPTPGLAFDGDADRVIAVDERGALVDGDQMLAIAAIDLHDRELLRGDAVVATVMSNLGLRRALAPYGIDAGRDAGRRPQRARRAGAPQPHARRRAVGPRDQYAATPPPATARSPGSCSSTR